MDIKEIEIIQPDDFHHHLRDGDVLPDVVKFASKTFSRIIVMPNINPPVKNVYDALQYKNRIIKFIPKESNLQLLMTIYLTDQTTEQDIINAKNSGFIFGAKFYQLPINYKKIKLIKKSWKVPDSYIFGNSLLYPLKSDEFIKWKQI